MSEVPLYGIEGGACGIAYVRSKDHPLLGYPMNPFAVCCVHLHVQAFRRLLYGGGFL